jgi:hypothetical protein
MALAAEGVPDGTLKTDNGEMAELAESPPVQAMVQDAELPVMERLLCSGDENPLGFDPKILWTRMSPQVTRMMQSGGAALHRVR